MPEQTVITFNRVRFFFRLYMLFTRHKIFIRFPVIRTHYSFGVILDFFPELFACFSSPGTHFTVDESVPISINSNPYPTVVFFWPIYVCISSNSITCISDGLRISSSFSPKDFIQLKTATWLTCSTLPIERKPRPSRYNIKASFFKLYGLPICSTVKRCLQSLHKYLCLDLTIPSLRKFSLLHFGQFFILISFLVNNCTKIIKLY